MLEGSYVNRKKLIISNRGYGVVVLPEPVYQYPEGHPCHGCVFTFNTSKPSCMTGGYPDTNNCINAFYKKLLARQRTEREKQLRRNVPENKQ